MEHKNLIAAYKVASENTREVLRALYPEADFDGVLKEGQNGNRPVTERIKTFDDACRELGENHPLVTQYKQIENAYIGDECTRDLIAYLKLRIITRALNEGWGPQFVEGERRWNIWYDLISKEKFDGLDDEDKRRCVLRSGTVSNAYGGLVFASAHSASWSSGTSGGARLAFKNEKLAAYAGRQFAEIYADFCFKSDAKAGSAEM